MLGISPKRERGVTLRAPSPSSLLAGDFRSPCSGRPPWRPDGGNAAVKACRSEVDPPSADRAATGGGRYRTALPRRPLAIWAVCVGIVLLLVPAQVRAWPGHTWSEWAKVTTWTKPQIESEQAGKKDLAPLLGGADGAIDGIKACETRRAHLAAVIQAVLGEPTNLAKPPPLEVQVIGEESLPDHVRRHIRLRTEPDDWMPAYLLLPRGAGRDSRQDGVREGIHAPARSAELGASPLLRLPAMICLHQTGPGKAEPAGMKGDTNLSLGLQLVRRGYVCIVPDAIGFGERIPSDGQPYHDSIKFYQRHPKWSFMGKMIWDVSRVCDYLESLPEVDPLQIGCIGHSHGAYGTIFAAAFEPRITAAIASCGFNTFRADPTPNRWSHLTALIPQIGMYLPNAASIPFDWQHVLALIAPRSLYVWNATQDACFPNTIGLGAVFEDVRRVYGLYGAADDLMYQPFDGAHSFPPEGRQLAYTWLEERLFPVTGQPGKWFAVSGEHAALAKAQLLQRVIRRSIGGPVHEFAALDVRTLEEESLPKYQRRLIEYTVAPGERIRAYLCVPAGSDHRLPAILVLHQTAPEGKREAVGVAGKKNFAFAAELAERGYVTLAPDSICAGERIDRFGAYDTRGYYLTHPELSAMGKMLHDAQRALDVLESLPRVDAGRLGTIGHSLGAEEALVLAALDERVRACISSCGHATLAAEKNRLRWARDAWFSYMPKLRPVLQRGKLPAWDWGDVVGLIAPRGYFQYAAENDQIFPEARSAHEAGLAAAPLWQACGKPEALVSRFGPGPHDFPEDVRQAAYRWLDQQLELREQR